ncbi:MAG TPA: hypothetical protein VMR18_02040 [Candidatus Saccharimonadales bacterium]|nr:hypothetical protein [Candidatus Saccharimonadales bacterium]
MDNQEPERQPSAPVGNDGQPAQVPNPPNDTPSGWKFSADEEPSGYQEKSPATKDPISVSWSASEFVEHKKSPSWYAVLVIVAIVLAAIVLVLTHDKISTGVVILAAILFGIYAGRQPRTLKYQLDEGGLTIADKFYPYDILKSFAVIDEGQATGILLIPLKRFMPQIPIYCSRDEEEKIIGVLSSRLPMEEHSDTIDNFMRRIRF